MKITRLPLRKTAARGTGIIIVFHNDSGQEAGIPGRMLFLLGLTWQPPGAAQNHKGQPKQIIALSHIETLPTYHKYFKELQVMGYIRNTPCYHPRIQK